MPQSLQLAFRDFEDHRRTAFGGSLLKGNPRHARPLSFKRPLHLVLRSTLATGERSFLRRAREVERIVRRSARRQNVRVYRLANSGNHLHLLVRPGSRHAYRAFIRSVTGLLARAMLGSRKRRPAREKFWDARPFSRVLAWGRDFRQAARYLLRNALEARGLIPYRERPAERAASRAANPPPRPG